MAKPLENHELQVQQDGSGLIEFFNLNRLVQTIDSISIEAKDEEEVLQLAINALCIFTGCPLGHIFLRDPVRRSVFRCSDVHYVRQPDPYGESHKRTLSDVYDESMSLIKQLATHPGPFISRDIAQDAQGLSVTFKVLVPLVSNKGLLGFFELVAFEEEEPDPFLLRVLRQIGYRVGATLNSFATSKELRKFRLAVEHSSDHIMITDADARILYANKAAEKMTGYSYEEMIGQRPSLWGKQMNKEFYEDMWETIKTNKQFFAAEINNTRKDGSAYITELHIAPIVDKDGDVEFFVGIERDITKDKEIDRMKTEFVSVASHQLRAPLTGIKLVIETLLEEDGKLGTQHKTDIEDMGRSVERLLGLVNDLLNVSKLETGRLQVEPKPTQLENFIQDIIDEAAPLAKERGCEVLFKKPKTKPPEASVDPALMRQVFHNLIANAVRYSPAKEGKVTVQLEQKDGDYLISVKDNGMGIPKEVQQRIFEKFFRADNAKEAQHVGSGLGLYISKMIMEASGGKVWFESEENKGTTFYVSLPAA